MIRITVELVPHGEERYARPIGSGYIYNTGDHPERPQLGNYRAVFVARGRRAEAHLTDWPRQTHDVWALIHEALSAAALHER